MRLSVVIPVLNEGDLIHRFLYYARKAAPDAEIIVVDGGSSDGTVDLAAPLADRVIAARCGRGGQMNAGAAAAKGDLLWFLHADSQISSEAVRSMMRFMSDEARYVGGCFALKIAPSRWIYRLRDVVGNWCVDVFGIALGDRALFCRRTAFEAVGGYAAEGLFEDAGFYRALRRIGPTRRLRSVIITSARRYEALGPVRTCLFYGVIMLLYWLGFPRDALEKCVLRFSSRSCPREIDASAERPSADIQEEKSSSFRLKPNL